MPEQELHLSVSCFVKLMSVWQQARMRRPPLAKAQDFPNLYPDTVS